MTFSTCFGVYDGQRSSGTLATHLGIQEIFFVIQKFVAALWFAETWPALDAFDVVARNPFEKGIPETWISN